MLCGRLCLSSAAAFELGFRAQVSDLGIMNWQPFYGLGGLGLWVRPKPKVSLSPV